MRGKIFKELKNEEGVRNKIKWSNFSKIINKRVLCVLRYTNLIVKQGKTHQKLERTRKVCSVCTTRIILTRNERCKGLLHSEDTASCEIFALTNYIVHNEERKLSSVRNIQKVTETGSELKNIAGKKKNHVINSCKQLRTLKVKNTRCS